MKDGRYSGGAVGDRDNRERKSGMLGLLLFAHRITDA